MKEVRDLYQEAAEHEKACRELVTLLEPYRTTQNAILYGYKATATMMMANYVFGPISKMKYFNKGKRMLEKAISSDPKNIELRLLRFQVQSNIPFFLGYKDHLEMDKNFILNNFSKITDTSLKRYIVSALKSSKNLTEENLKELKIKLKPLRH